jgi:pimeloyl-ACP methyl ester carboxylesterase
MTRIHLPLELCALVLWLLAGRPANAQEAAPRFEPGPCPSELANQGGLHCGTLVTLESYYDPGGPLVRLPVMILESLSQTPAADPILFIKGGPGATSIWTVPVLAHTPWRQERKIIVLEQRGAAAAEPGLHCHPGLLVRGALPCLESLLARGLELEHYTTAAMAADLPALRRALGLERWNLYGDAYSTRLILLNLALDPEGVRSAVLDSPHPATANVYESGPANFRRALAAFFESCRSDPACDSAYPALEERFWALVRHLNAEPARLTIGLEVSGEPIILALDGDWFLNQTFDALYGALDRSDALAYWPLLISLLEQGESGYLMAWIDNPVINWEQRLAFGMYFSAMCQDEYGRADASLLLAQDGRYPQLSGWAAGAFGRATCQAWQLAPAPEPGAEAVTSPAPVLLLSGTHAPVTPPEWAKETSLTLPNSFLVTVPGTGQWVSAFDACAQRLIDDFLSDPGRAPDASCLEEPGPYQAILPGDVRLAPGLYRLYGDVLGPDPHRLRSLILNTGLALSLLTLLYLPAAAVIVVVSGRRGAAVPGGGAIAAMLAAMVAAGAAAGLNLAFALSLLGVLRELESLATPMLHFGLPSAYGRLLLLPAISNVLAALLFVAVFVVWIRKEWDVVTRLAFSLATLGAVICSSLAAYWGLLPY